MAVFHSLDAFVAALLAQPRLMGLDVGSKTIGVALSNSAWSIASPLETVQRRKFTLDAQHLLGLAEEERIGGLIIGLPLNMDGTEGRMAQSIRSFAANLAELTDLPIGFFDERLTSHAAEQEMIEADDLSRAKRAANVDKLAAALILQGALDRLLAIK